MEQINKKSNNVKITIIIPVYNCEKYLEQCLCSVLNQTIRDLEIICINDGSTDNSVSIINRYLKQDDRIILLNQKNQGPGKSRNLGIARAKGKYAAFIDADDYYLESDALEKMFSACEDNHVKAAGSLRKSLIDGVEKTERLFEDILQKKLQPDGDLEHENVGIITYEECQMDYDYQSFLFERKMLQDNQILFPDYRRFQDPPFLVKALHAAGTFAVVKAYLYCYRYSGVLSRFDTAKTADLLKGLTENLVFAQEHHLDILFENTVSRMEYEYAGVILRNISPGDLNILKLLLDANQIICTYYCDRNFVLRPLRMVLEDAASGIAAYENRLLQQIQKQEAVYIYGAGKLAKKFINYLRSKRLLEKISAVIVSDLNSNPGASAFETEGIALREVCDERIANKERLVLIVAGYIYYKDIIKSLTRNGFANYEALDYSFLEGL